MLTIKNEKGIFQLRVAAVIRKKDKILLLNEDHVTYWFLPGGRCEMNETTKYTIERELLEEMNAKVKIKNLLWIIENFFVLRGSPFHEIGFYYEAIIPKNHPLNTLDEFIFENEENGKIKKYHFKWFKISKIKKLDIRPPCIKNMFSSKSKNIKQIIHKD
jgi:ADP-ribose pyrophosphatase YjhB (NUDIX family)